MPPMHVYEVRVIVIRPLARPMKRAVLPPEGSRVLENQRKQTRRFIVVGDEGEPLIVAGDPALVLERTLCKRRSGGRLLQESWSIDFQAFAASASAGAP